MRNTKKIEELYQEYIEQQEIQSNAEIEMEKISELLKQKISRKNRYWRDKEIENLRSKIWRLQKKLDTMINEKNGKDDDLSTK